MPYIYIGRTTYFKGKTIWEIVGNLKNFGVGRVLVRSRFEHYPEPSYIRIKSVEPEANPEKPSMDVSLLTFSQIFPDCFCFRICVECKCM